MKNLRFVVSNESAKAILNNDEYAELLDNYRQTFMKMNGVDLFDAFLGVTKTKIDDKQRNKVKEFASNYNLAEEALIEVDNEYSLKTLLVYNRNNILIGGGRLRLDSIQKEALIPDLVIFSKNAKSNRQIWETSVKFVEEYVKKLGFSKLSVEIPKGDPALLGHVDNLGYIENISDNLIADFHTYLVEKELERTI